MNIYEKLSNIQNELKCNKNQFNKFGGYKYRSCEDILEAVKPICKKYKTVLVLSDSIVVLGDGNAEIFEDKNGKDNESKQIKSGQRFYVQATARLTDIEANKENEDTCISNTAYAREEESKKGMDGSQITGTASSYARKYALNGLFNIDDTKDADTNEFKMQQGNEYQVTEEAPKLTNEEIKILEATQKKYNVSDERVKDILQKYNYKSFKEVQKSDYAKIGNELSKKEEK